MPVNVTLSPYLLKALEEPAPLYEQRSPTEIASAYLSLDLPARTLGFVTRYKGDGRSMQEFHGFIILASVPREVSGGGLRRLVEDPVLLASASAACDHHASRWDGSNEVATTDDHGGAEAHWVEAVERAALSVEVAEVWQAADWLQSATTKRKDGRGYDIDGVGAITDRSGRPTIDRIEAAITGDLPHGTVLVELRRHLEHLQEDARNLAALRPQMGRGR